MTHRTRQRVTTTLASIAVLALSACGQPSPGEFAPPAPSTTSAAPAPSTTPSTTTTPAPDSAPPTQASPAPVTVTLGDWITLTIPADWTAQDDDGSRHDFSSHEVLDDRGERVVRMYYDHRNIGSDDLGCLPAAVESAELDRQALPGALPGATPEKQVWRVTTVVGMDQWRDGETEPTYVWEVRASLQEQEQIRGPECAMPSAMYPASGGVVQVRVANDGVVFGTREEAEQYAESDEFREIEAVLDSVQLTL